MKQWGDDLSYGEVQKEKTTKEPLRKDVLIGWAGECPPQGRAEKKKTPRNLEARLERQKKEASERAGQRRAQEGSRAPQAAAKREREPQRMLSGLVRRCLVTWERRLLWPGSQIAGG